MANTDLQEVLLQLRQKDIIIEQQKQRIFELEEELERYTKVRLQQTNQFADTSCRLKKKEEDQRILLIPTRQRKQRLDTGQQKNTLDFWKL